MGSIRGLIQLVLRRAIERPGLVAIRLFGVLVAVSLVTSVALYSGAMGDAMLQARLRSDSGSTYFAVSVAGGTALGPKYAVLDRYIRGQLSTDLGLPLHSQLVHHSTGSVPLYRVSSPHPPRAGSALGAVALNYDEGLRAHATLVAGQFDAPVGATAGGAAVLLSRTMAQRLHVRVGDRLAFSSNGVRLLRPLLLVVGVFVPRDPNGGYWSISSPASTVAEIVTTRLSTFQTLAGHALLFNPEYFWLERTDLRAIHLADATAILDRLTRLDSTLSAIAPAATLLNSSAQDINGFLFQYDLLPSILLILVAPIVALILYAVAVTTALVLERQAGEILLMRSRGAARSHVFVIYLVEGMLFGAIALLIGPLLGLLLAHLIGRASGFLTFGGGLAIDLRLTAQTYLLAGITALLCLLVGLLPAMRLAARSLLAYRAEQARSGHPPLWQCLYLDVVALAISLYGLVVLHRQGPVNTGAATAAVAQDPLIALAPLLFAISISLLIGRLLPWLAGGGLRLLASFLSPPMHIALQSLARAPRQHMRLVQLCTLTLTLGIFAATVAGIEARNEADQQAYEAGATVRLQEFVQSTHGIGTIMPLADHLALPGVHAVTPALRFETVGDISNSTSDGTNVNVLGIDPRTAGRVIWYRPDFAALPLDRLLALLDTLSPNALVSDTFLHATGLHPGDTFQVLLTNDQRVGARIAGVVHYFPTLDPRAYPFVIISLAYLERASRTHAPNEVWLAADPTRPAIDRLMRAAHAWGIQILENDVLLPAGDAGQNPLKVGIYGVISVGFMIAVALALLGLIAHAYLSLQQRLAEFAIVRALGLSAGGMRALLLYEQVFLLGAAMLGGIVAGVLTTQLFLPYLPIATYTMPPFLVVTPWSAIAAFALAMLGIFLLILGVYLTLVLRLHLGRVLRLGDA